jgi:hypothetical protein
MPDNTPEAVTPLFDDDDTRRSFPAPLAVALNVMMSEISESGEHTTADETAGAIEETFLWLGRVWVAEYLHAVDNDEAFFSEHLNRDLMEHASASKPTTTGRWVGLARRIRDHFGGRPTVVADLASIDFTDDAGQLLHFRNHFSHGSFSSTIAEIREHRQMLHDLLARVPALRDQPPLCQDVETGLVRAATGRWPEHEIQEPLPAAHPVIIGQDGARLDLYPLLHLALQSAQWSLSAPNSTHPASQMLQTSALAAWLERYEYQRQGHLPYEGPQDPSLLHADSARELGARLQGLVLVVGHPGCGAGAAIAALTQEDPLSLGLKCFAAIRRVDIQPGDPGQSGLTVGRVVLRLVEEALGEESGSRASNIKNILAKGGALESACDALRSADKRILLGLHDLHHGADPYRGEPITVHDVYNALVGTSVTVVATTVPGGMTKPLFDQKISLQPSDTPDPSEVSDWVAHLTHGNPLRTRILRSLVDASEPLHLFALCDALEIDNEPVFEPAVERALWDLQPLLAWQRSEMDVEEGVTENVRRWSPFSSALGPLVDAVLGGKA